MMMMMMMVMMMVMMLLLCNEGSGKIVTINRGYQFPE